MTITADLNTSISVPFSRWRQMMEDSGRLVEGVAGSTHLAVSQRAAGANMSVDVAVGQAWVEVDTGTRNGLGHVVSDAVTNVAVTAAHATLPRVDQVVLQWNESFIPTGSGDVPTLAVLAGTPTTGAQAANPTGANYRAGAAALGNDRLLLADLLVTPTSTSVVTANIVDRRPSATTPGAFYAYRNATQSIPNVTQTTIAYNAELYDDSNWFDVNIGRYTPQIAGRYRFSWLVKAPSAVAVSTNWQTMLRKNGADYAYGMDGFQAGTLQSVGSGGSATAIANGTTDFFEVTLRQDSGGAVNASGAVIGNYFTGELIGRF